MVATPTVDTITAAARILNLIFDLPNRRLFERQHDDTNTKQPFLKGKGRGSRARRDRGHGARHRDRLRDANSCQLSDGTIPAMPAPTASPGVTSKATLTALAPTPVEIWNGVERRSNT
jgi:hypothetical protein